MAAILSLAMHGLVILLWLEAIAIAAASRGGGPRYQILRLGNHDGGFHPRANIAPLAAWNHVGDHGSSWVIPISARDSLHCPFAKEAGDNTPETLLLQRLRRDRSRVVAINSRVNVALRRSPAVTSALRPDSVAPAFRSPLYPGASSGSGEYFTRIGVGTPAKFSYLIVDTGSDLTWMQCAPCTSCYNQSDPIFDPSSSSSFRSVDCASTFCAMLDNSACNDINCMYQVGYGDGSFTAGSLATETLTFGANVNIPGITIGCGHDNEGLFVAAASGLLGLGRGPPSFTSQIASHTFSYCLPTRMSTDPGSLTFGESTSAHPAGTTFTPLLQNPLLSTFYYIALVGISVGGNSLPISPSKFQLSESGSGGVIVDSGTSVTRFTAPVYSTLRDSFRAAMPTSVTFRNFSLLDTCFDFSQLETKTIQVPTVDLHFKGGATMSLPASNYLIPVDSSNTYYCFAFAPTSGDLSIIGNFQQQTYRVLFDTSVSRIGFSANQC